MYAWNGQKNVEVAKERKREGIRDIET